MAAPNIQDHHQWYNDDGGPNNPNNATPKGAEDAVIDWIPLTNIRLRIKFHSQSGDFSAYSYFMSFNLDGGATWGKMGLMPSTIAPWISDSPNFATNSATTERLTNSGGSTWLNGVAQDTSVPWSLTLPSSTRTELEYCLKFPAEFSGHFVRFRMNGGSVGFAYPIDPTLYTRINIGARPSLKVSGGTLKEFGGTLKVF